jgi:hypothetical protein
VHSSDLLLFGLVITLRVTVQFKITQANLQSVHIGLRKSSRVELGVFRVDLVENYFDSFALIFEEIFMNLNIVLSGQRSFEPLICDSKVYYPNFTLPSVTGGRWMRK